MPWISPSSRAAAAWAAIVFATVAPGGAGAKDAPIDSLDAEHFKNTATVVEDPSSGLTTISTEPGYAEHTGLMRMVWHDEFLRGVIDRRSGARHLEVETMIIYEGRARAYRTATFMTPDGRRTAAVTRSSTRVENCAVTPCAYTERLDFPIEESLLRELAARAASGRPPLWSYELTSPAAPAYVGKISGAEISGFLAKLDDYLGSPGIAASTAGASLKADLGLSGMAVEAGAEQPPRSGILVTGINRDSAAQRAGLLVGDIVFELNGAAVRDLAQLQAAVARCGPRASASIRFYRGTATLSRDLQFQGP